MKDVPTTSSKVGDTEASLRNDLDLVTLLGVGSLEWSTWTHLSRKHQGVSVHFGKCCPQAQHAGRASEVVWEGKPMFERQDDTE